MIFSLLLVEKEGLGCPSSPQLLSGLGFAELLHLVYESKARNKPASNAMLTRYSQVVENGVSTIKRGRNQRTCIGRVHVLSERRKSPALSR